MPISAGPAANQGAAALFKTGKNGTACLYSGLPSGKEQGMDGKVKGNPIAVQPVGKVTDGGSGSTVLARLSGFVEGVIAHCPDAAQKAGRKNLAGVEKTKGIHQGGGAAVKFRRLGDRKTFHE